MKVLILGTSNSILANGWSYGLSDALKDHEIVNMSIGASPGIQFADKMRLDFSQYKYVFFDSIPNDEEYSNKAKGYTFNKKNERITFEILSTIASQTSLIILGFCNKWAFHEESDIYKSRKAIAQKIGCQFIDTRSLLKAFLHGNTVDSLYESHPAHPKREISYEIGKVIGEEILNCNLAFKNDCQNYSKNFITESATSFGDNIIKLENRWLSMEVLKADINTPIQVNSNYSCLGIYIETCNTHCILTYTDFHNSKHHVHLTYNQNRPEGKFVKVFVPFYEAPKIKNISLNDMTLEGAIYYPVMTHENNDIAHKLHLSSLIYWNDHQENEINNDISHNINHLFLSYTVAHRLLENTIPFKYYENKMGRIRTHHNSYILFDKITKRVWHDTPERITDTIAPVVLVKSNDTIISATSEEYGANIIDIFGERGVTIHMQHKHITFMKDGKYLSAGRRGKLTFSADVEKAWERFYVN